MLPGIPEDDVFLLGAAFENVIYPVQTSTFFLCLHVGTDVVVVDLRCLGYHAEDLVRVFLDMLHCAGPDEVEFEVACITLVLAFGINTGGCEVPSVNVVVT